MKRRSIRGVVGVIAIVALAAVAFVAANQFTDSKVPPLGGSSPPALEITR